MKNLIETLKRIKNKMTISNTIDILNSVIFLIEQNELKQFNPIEIGFELNDNIYYKKFSEGFICSIQKCHLGEFEWYLLLYKNYKNKVVNPITTLMITIPNHRQGVELLRNLGVVE